MGVGLTYGSKKIDFNQLNFEHQFAGYGFNTNLPTGEAALTNMQSYFSASAGLLYSYVSQYSNFDFGAAAFHLNKPKQTVVNDPNQYLAPRYVIHANYDNHLNEKVVLNTNAIFQTQAKASYFSVGGGLGYFLSEEGRRRSDFKWRTLVLVTIMLLYHMSGWFIKIINLALAMM